LLTSLRDPSHPSTLSADTAVVGAGLAGLVLAQALVDQGLSVVVLESGAKTQPEEPHPLNAVETGRQAYTGADHGRYRCLGGTSTRWGAALLPFLKADFGPHPCGWHDGWGIDPDALDAALTAHLAALEERFGMAHVPYEGSEAAAGFLTSFLPRVPKWPAFENRSTAHIFRAEIQKNPRLHVVTDATVTEITLRTKGGNPAVQGLVAQTTPDGTTGEGNGVRLTLTAPRVALAAGAIETTRLLLLLDHAQNTGGATGQEDAGADGLLSADRPLGWGFHDHLSAPIATLDTDDPAACARLFSFEFRDGGMRNLRFELAPEVRAAMGLPAAFLHIAFARSGQSGFDGLRGIFQALQRKSLPAARDIFTLLKDLPWFLRAVWWRLVERRVLPPKGTTFELHLVIEQRPDPDNRLTLSTTERDPFGLPRLRIDWQVGAEDKANFARIADLVVSEWNAGPLGALAPARARPAEAVGLHIVEGGGIYHPAGTTRIGATARDGVVDAELRVHGVDGLWAVSTAAFPSVGGTSPSLGLMQFAMRAAKDIARR